MIERHVDPEAVLADLKDFQRRTAKWAFERMFDDEDPAVRFLVADEVGLGKTHVAKGVIAQVIDYLQRIGDKRHDIVYICSNGAIARQNLRKLVPPGIEPLEDVERLTMLPLAELDQGRDGRTGVNLLAITPGTSLTFGRTTGKFKERCLAYAFLRHLWGPDVMNDRARWIFWAGIKANEPDAQLRQLASKYQPVIEDCHVDFALLVREADERRRSQGRPALRERFDEIVDGLAYKRRPDFPASLKEPRADLISEVRRIMATVGILALQPDLVVLDEFQRFKDLLRPEPSDFASSLAHRLFNHIEPETRRPTRTLLLSATPYRMYTGAEDAAGDHYADFLDTCEFLFRSPKRVDRLRGRFASFRNALTSKGSLNDAETICHDIERDLRSVMARTERLASTPDRDGMLCELDAIVSVEPDDLRAYLRLGDLAEAVEHHEPTEYWKAGPYLFNFMEQYKLKDAFDRATEDGLLPDGEDLRPGPGLLDWDDIQAYEAIDPQNGRLRWLIEDLDRHRAFELLWIPPSLRYYKTGSVYESAGAQRFTKRLIFSGWALVPKVVSALVSFDAERRAVTDRKHDYSADYSRRGGQRLTFRAEQRTAAEARPGESTTSRRAAAMTSFLLVWPSPTLAALGDPRKSTSATRTIGEVFETVQWQMIQALRPLLDTAPDDGPIDQRWYWAAPLLLDHQAHPAAVELLLGEHGPACWEQEPGTGFLTHHDEARALLSYGSSALGRPPADLARVLSEIAVGGPGPCALRALRSASGLTDTDEPVLRGAARVAAAFRTFFNAPEVTGVVTSSRPGSADSDQPTTPYWQAVIRHCTDGNLQALLDEHAHVLRDWLGHVTLLNAERRAVAVEDIATRIADALDVRTSSFRVDVPERGRSQTLQIDEHRMRTRFAVAFGHQTLEGGGEARVESVSNAFNSPFWPFVLTSTSVGQEGLDFHLWCHAVVHWNLPTNPVDLEQREGRVHRYKGHAVRRNIAATVGPAALTDGLAPDADPWDDLFQRATNMRGAEDDEMVPYWVFHQGPAKIERHVPVLPFSRDTIVLPRLRETLAAYRLAFGQPRQEELIELLGTDRSDTDLLLLASRLRIDLTPPAIDDLAAPT